MGSMELCFLGGTLSLRVMGDNSDAEAQIFHMMDQEPQGAC